MTVFSLFFVLTRFLFRKFNLPVASRSGVGRHTLFHALFIHALFSLWNEYRMLIFAFYVEEGKTAPAS